jgi:hypothetical protein
MLQFINSYPHRLDLTIMWFTPNCVDGGDWTKSGWWALSPGQSAVVHGADLADINRFWCYLACSPGASGRAARTPSKSGTASSTWAIAMT